MSGAKYDEYWDVGVDVTTVRRSSNQIRAAAARLRELEAVSKLTFLV